MSKIRMALDNWTYQDFTDFVASNNTGDKKTSYRLAEKLIVEWDFDVPLSGSDPLMELSLADSSEVIRTVMNAVKNFADTIEVDHVRVDLGKWNTRKFLEFDEQLQKGNVAKIEKALREVTFHPEVDNASDKPLTFSQGVEMIGAVRTAYNKLISGKN